VETEKWKPTLQKSWNLEPEEKTLKMNSSGWNSKQGSTHTKRERLLLTTIWWKPMLYFGEDAPKGCKTRLREERISGSR
jgi:hypothetical protein